MEIIFYLQREEKKAKNFMAKKIVFWIVKWLHLWGIGGCGRCNGAWHRSL